MLLIISCSESEKTDELNENNEITAAATSKIYRACKYPNDDFCENECCKSNEKCNGEIAYRECDLETGEWKSGVFSDSGCSTACEADSDDADTSTEIIELNQKKCAEGWKCISRFEKTYRNSDCSFGETVRCKAGCANDSCTRTCAPGNLSCRKDSLLKCDENGEAWEFYMNCAYGCENSSCLISVATNQTQNTTQPTIDNNYLEDGCISVINFNYDAAGSDNSSNLNDEYFTIKNACSYSIDISNWIAKDIANHAFTFPVFNFGKDVEVTIHTGSGTADATNLYWGRGSHVWNNPGDTLYLNTPNGTSVLIYSYP